MKTLQEPITIVSCFEVLRERAKDLIRKSLVCFSSARAWRFVLPITGFVALIWFLIRVVPKPSRAAYPCQRAAFPLASAFVIWVAGIAGSYLSFKRARAYFAQSKYGLAVSFLALALLAFGITQFQISSEQAFASRPGQNILPLYQVQVEPKFHISSESAITPVSTVSILQSSKPNVSEIDEAEIRTLVREAVRLAGGLESVIQNGDMVVLKPNMVVYHLAYPTPRDLAPEVNGITTDWRVAKAVVELVRELNPDGKVYVIEGSAGGRTRDNYIGFNYTHGNIPGVDEFIALEESGAWEEWNSPKLVSVTLPAGKGLYANRLKPNRSEEFYLNKLYYEADVVISLPVLKNHADTGITGAVKNVGIGATPQNIYGGEPGENQRWVNQRINHNGLNLHRWIHDFYLCKQVDFVIMDGLQGSTNGPVSGVTGSPSLEANQKNMRLILASKDPLAIDAIQALVMGFDPSKVMHLVYLARDSVGCINSSYIGVEGSKVHEVRKVFAFTNQSEEGNAARHYDFTAPAVLVDSARVVDRKIYLSLSADSQTRKVEFEIDGVKYDKTIIGGFTDIVLEPEGLGTRTHVVKIFAYDQYLNCTVLEVNAEPTGVADRNEIPISFELLQNYPNPFTPLDNSSQGHSSRGTILSNGVNPSTTIVYSLSRPGKVHLTICNELGERVRTLVDEEKSVGTYSVEWDGRDDGGITVASGAYFYTCQVDDKARISKRMLMVR